MGSSSYHGYIPENAEVIVDYTKPPKDRVQFHYPVERNYKQAIWHGAYHTFLNYWMLCNVFFAIPTIIGFCIGFALGWATLFINHYGILILIGSFMQPHPAQATTSSSNFADIFQALSLALSLYLWVYGVPYIATKLAARKPDMLANMIPQMNYSMVKAEKRLKFKKVTPSEVFDRTFRIFNFSNVYLDYKATGEMAEYLQKIEVLAIPYDDYLRYPSMKPRRTRNEYEFSAIFKFKRTPKTGSLKVIFC